MGGPCDAPISGETKEEVMANGMRHLEEAHPEMAEDVKNAAPDSPMMVTWNEKFDKDFEEAPEVSS